MAESFLFYDLETFGSDPRRSRIAQFAAIRTDAALEVIETPVSMLVQPADDLLPSPVATLITGITPQHARAEGMPEAEALARIHDLVATPGTCTLGYNSIRFDDEFLRFGFWRNFQPIYTREWEHGNSRFDLLDMLRLTHALRPQGIVWPARADGSGITSFKLEDLATANGVRDGSAHEALSDVRATLGMARAVLRAQPRLWHYALQLRAKAIVSELLDAIKPRILLHVSGRYPGERLHAAAVLPLVALDHKQRETVVADLGDDPGDWLHLDAEAITDRVFTARADLPEGVKRIGLKIVHNNRAPMLVPWEYLRGDDFARLGLDPQRIERHAAALRAAQPALAETMRRVFARSADNGARDPDQALYGGGFLSHQDELERQRVRATPPTLLGQSVFAFRDGQQAALLLRYRARNWPQTLSAEERAAWDAYRQQRLFEDRDLGEASYAQWQAEIASLRATRGHEPGVLPLLDALHAWGAAITAGLDPA